LALPRRAAATAETPARGSVVDLRFLGHASLLLELGGTRILTDPFLRRGLGPLQRHGPVPDPEALGPIDLVLISHGHPDHFDPVSLAALPGRPTVIVPRGLGEVTRRSVRGEVIELDASGSVEVRGLVVEAVPARHWMTPGAPRAQPQGYLIDGAPRVWFAGDTGPFAGLAALRGRVDVALVPVWTWGPHLGPGHLGPRSAAEIVASIDAAAAVPIHWGTLYPRRLHRLWRGPLHEPGDRFATHVARLAPGIDVRVLRPGEAARIECNPLRGR
jgi:L-ascorbate metabolism protein UlaG (beta-lactamase superfamily)